MMYIYYFISNKSQLPIYFTRSPVINITMLVRRPGFIVQETGLIEEISITFRKKLWINTSSIKFLFYGEKIAKYPPPLGRGGEAYG